jgi:DNA recombination protein RmuC
MEPILLVVIVILFAAIAWRLWRPSALPPPPPPAKDDSQSLLMLQHQMEELRRTLDSRLSESTRTVLNQSGENIKIIRDITGAITKMTEGQNEGQKQTGAISDQLRNLNDILKNTKQRGILGEYFLETVLKNVLAPGSYQLQYPFKDNSKVDAVIFYQEKIIPIDSKFSLENYNRLAGGAVISDDERKRYTDALRADLKTRIDETSKYIKPGEDTVDFAFMFIPSEALYYDLLINKIGATSERDLIQYAAEKRVYPVSPTTFYVYLQMVLQGLRQMQINKSAQQIIKGVGELQRHLVKYEDFLDKIGTHLATTTNAYTTATKEFAKIDKDIVRLGNLPKDALPEAETEVAINSKDSGAEE